MEDPNPVVASLLCQLSETIIEAGGVDGCSVEDARKFGELAMACLPLLDPDEDDIVSADFAPRFGADEIDSARLAGVLPIPSRVNPVGSVQWAVGVTTAPRRQPTLDACLDRLAVAGWPEPYLLIDGQVDLAERHQHLLATRRSTSSGGWPNYYLAMAELLLRAPDADAYMLMQDDVLVANSTALRQYVDSLLWPTGSDCLVSLYCAADDTQASNGWHIYDGQWTLGALAFVYSPGAARGFVRDPRVCDHRRLGGEKNGKAGIDAVIGDWAFRNGVPIWFPTPSLVQHVGNTSAIWESSRAVGLRRAVRFIDDEIE